MRKRPLYPFLKVRITSTFASGRIWRSLWRTCAGLPDAVSVREFDVGNGLEWDDQNRGIIGKPAQPLRFRAGPRGRDLWVWGPIFGRPKRRSNSAALDLAFAGAGGRVMRTALRFQPSMCLKNSGRRWFWRRSKFQFSGWRRFRREWRRGGRLLQAPRRGPMMPARAASSRFSGT